MATLLLVEDDISVLVNLTLLFEAVPYRIVKASNLALASKLLVEDPPDLVVLEVELDANAGWDWLARISGKVPVMVLSSLGREEDIVRGFDAGAVDYIAKPYRSQEVLARVRRQLALVSTRTTVPQPTVMEQPLRLVPDETSDSHSIKSTDPANDRRPKALPLSAMAGEQRAPATPAESVFISEAEELALVRGGEAALPFTPTVESEPTTLGQLLHRERVRRRLTLVQIENDLKIRMSYMRAIEEDRMTLLPRGPLASQMIRTYATYLDQGSHPLLQAALQRVPVDLAELPLGLGGPHQVRPFVIPRWVIILLAVILALVAALSLILWLDPNGVNQLLAPIRGGFSQP